MTTQQFWSTQARAAPAIPILLALDCDGTLSTSNGPVTPETLMRLRKLGVIIVIVSTSAGCDKLVADPYTFERFAPTDRAEALKRLAERYPDARRIYCGDTDGDRQLALANQYEYLTPQQLQEWQP